MKLLFIIFALLIAGIFSGAHAHEYDTAAMDRFCEQQEAEIIREHAITPDGHWKYESNDIHRHLIPQTYDVKQREFAAAVAKINAAGKEHYHGR